MTETPHVGAMVHFYHVEMGITIGPSAAIVTRIYEMVDKEESALCVDLAIFPQYGDRFTPRADCMIWHRESAERDRDPHRWWQWRDDGPPVDGRATGKDE